MINKISKKIVDVFPQLARFISVNYGLIREDLKDEDWVFGADNLNKQVLQEDGQWDKYLPGYELQRGRNFDTMGCVSFSLLNCVEILAKRKFNEDWNKSDRFTAKMSNTSIRGNTMSNVITSARKDGVINEKTYSWDRDKLNWNEYYAAIDKKLIEVGQGFLADYDINYEYIPEDRKLIKEALKYSPVWCCGYSWYERGGLYRNVGVANHCFLIYGYKEGEYWKAYDSYAPFTKRLAWDYNISYPKAVYLSAREQKFNKNELSKLYDRGLIYIMRVQNNGEIYKIDKDKLSYVEPQEWNNINVKITADQKKLVGVSEEFYSKLFL